MKKLFLAVALVAASLSANAVDYTFGVSSVADFNSQYTVSGDATNTTAPEYTDATNTTFKDMWIGFDATGYCTMNNSPITLAASKANTTQWKLYSDYIQPNGTGRILKIATTVGDVITITVKDAYASGNLVTTGVAETLSGTVAAGGTFTVTATGTEITLTDNTTKPKYQKVSVVTSGIKDAISSDLLKLAGTSLVNPTALSVEVYSVTGVKVLTSAKTSINVSELPQGVYVAKTAKGTLKFIK